MPAMTGVGITATEFLRHADGRIPTLAGVKFTHEDLNDYRAARAYADGKYAILFGRDEILLSGLELGAPGAVGSTYNYAAPLYTRIINAHRAGDAELARADQAKARAFIDVMVAKGGLPAGKAIMNLIGVDCGPVRLPLRRLSPADIASLREALSTVGFFDFASRV
jgi:N-acetylneuraminate lyase